MRLIRLKLGYSVPFWILKPIALRRGEQEVSPLLNIDVLTDGQKAIINKSIMNREISVYDGNNNPVANLYDVNLYQANNVSIDDDEDEDESVYPEIVAVTIDDKEEEIIPKEIDNDAEVLLSKNGNTIKKLVSTMDNSKHNKNLLEISLKLEHASKNRHGVIKYIKKKLLEF